MNYILTLTTQSYLLTGSGEGGVLIDADVVFHATGFPMIPARRIKGMLKESLEEVMEISGKTETDINAAVTSFFGDPGKPTYEGKLLFHSLLLPGWTQITKELSANHGYSGFQPDFIKAYFTAEIQQTAIGREDKEGEIEGVAKKRSLRNYRVIKPGFSFEGLLETTSPLSEDETTLLQRAVLNLRHAGTRRNRGFGKVKCGLKEAPADSFGNQTIAASSSGKLALTITTQSPVVLAEQLGDQNTVFTRKYISGNQVRGLLANTFIRKTGLSTANAHLDADFFALFLSGKVHFGDAVFKQSRPIPLHLHNYKLDKAKPVISVFAKSEDDNEITKSVGKIGVIAGSRIHTDGFTPKTTFNFHNSRPNRAAGRSTEGDTDMGIFYYESLNEGQAFQGSITGESALINKLTSTLSAQFRARMGRSRSAQYGSVLVSLDNSQSSDTTTFLSAGVYVMTLQSPLILLNEYGQPSPTVACLSRVLSEHWGIEVNIEKAAAAFTQVEQFNAIWLAKSDQTPAFKEGSSFLIHVSDAKEAPTQLGEWAEQGFGQVVFEPYRSETVYKLNSPEKNCKKQEEPQSDAEVSSPVLVAIKLAYKEEEKQLAVKSKAIEAAQNSKRINNHLIGRVESMFQQATSQGDVEEWIKALFRENSSGKPAAEALLNAGVLYEVSEKEYKETEVKAKFAETKLGKLTFELTRIYWITFFQTLRKKIKSDGK